MMRRLVERHHGILPLDTAESIWRVIIATFTYVQAPFSVHADLSAGDAAMRDSARFHFGFTVPFVPHIGAAGVVEAVSESKGDLGLVPAFATSRRRRLVDRARIRRARRRSSRGCRSSSAPTIRRALPVFVHLARRRRRHGDRGRDLERAGRRLGRRRGPRARSALAEVDRGAGPRLRRRGAAGFGAGRRRSDDDQGRAGQGRRLGALGGPRRQPRDPLYGAGQARP